MTDEQNPRDIRPTIKLTFNGLFLFCFDTDEEESNMCHAGVLTTGLDHELSVSIFETTNVGTDETPVYNHSKKVFTLCQATCRMLGDVYLCVKPYSGKVEPVRRYEYGDGSPIDRSDDYMETDPANFKWIIDFENGEFGDQKLDIAPGVFSPVLHINTGTFYTDLVAEYSYDIVRADEARRGFGRVAETISANLELEPEDEIVLEDSNQNPLWKLNRNSKATYWIHFQNVCPEYKTSLATDFLKANMLAHGERSIEIEGEKLMEEPQDATKQKKVIQKVRSDFHYYYDAFRNRSGLQHHDFKLRGESGLYPSVCYSSTGSKQNSFPSKPE